MDIENILIWNARGVGRAEALQEYNKVCRKLNGRARRAALADLVAQERVSLVCVQETKLSSIDVSVMNDMLGSRSVLSKKVTHITHSHLVIRSNS
jgi:hypothetical protein